MTLNVAMHPAARDRVSDRLVALELPLRLLTLLEDGRCMVDDRPRPLAEAPAEAVWLTAEMGGRAFENCLKSIAASHTVKWLQTFNAGLDHPGYRAIAARGIRIGASSAQAVAISEYVFAHVLDLYQGLAERRAAQEAGEWKRLPFREVAGTTWLMVGYGNIGREIGRRADAFGARVVGVRRGAAPAPHADEIIAMNDLADRLGGADVVVLCCPHSSETDRLVDAGFLAAMKQGAVLVNVARGGVVEDAALLAALDSGKVGAAVLDVFEPEPLPRSSPYWTHPSVRLTGHCSFAGNGTRSRADDLFIANLPRYAGGEALVNEVDLKVYLETLP
ncbi:MAG: D-2-hydroxyacid dehydrogenase [Alphaproteobacteria bacterium]|nr:D-2-hydroxyacid dehydrogenase [Alphaproteobacteria bacterium]